MIRKMLDGVFGKHPFFRDVCFRWLPFASGSFNGEAWVKYMDQHPSCVDEILSLADSGGVRLIKRLVYRKRRNRYVCTIDEAVRYLKVLKTTVKYWFPADGTMLRSVFAYKAGSSYLPVVPDLTDRVIIDGGAASGDSSVALLELGPQKVMAFEPSPRQRQEIVKVLRQNKLERGIEVVPRALSDKRKTLRFSDQYSEMYDAEATSIDEFARDLNVGLVKLDIEGAEFPALKGMVETLRRCHPCLLICVYHNPEDLFEMPRWLIENFPEYRMIFRDTEPGNKGAGVHLMMVAWPVFHDRA